jgi:hypothetical protein
MIGDLIRAVHTHEIANGFDTTDPADIEEDVCKQAALAGIKGWCRFVSYDPDEHRRTTKGRTGWKIEMSRAFRGLKALSSWFGKGWVSQEVAEARASVCVNCNLNLDLNCASCKAGSFAAQLARLVGNKKTSLDAKLDHCDACGCALKLKVWAPTSVVLSNTTPATMSQLPEACWIRKESIS